MKGPIERYRQEVARERAVQLLAGVPHWRLVRSADLQDYLTEGTWVVLRQRRWKVSPGCYRVTYLEASRGIIVKYGIGGLWVHKWDLIEAIDRGAVSDVQRPRP